MSIYYQPVDYLSDSPAWGRIKTYARAITLAYTSLEELAGWAYDPSDDHREVTEADIDVAAEIAEADEFWFHQQCEYDPTDRK
jgi:hypothetical protein